jgi:two-component system, LuxR family, sensor kinase FixL
MNSGGGSNMRSWMPGFAGAGRRAGPVLAFTAAYLGVYLLLDRVSFIEALHGIDITPWNPPPGLTLALLTVRGLAYTPLVFVAALLSSQLIPLVWVSPLASIVGALVTAAGYAAAAAVLRRGLGIESRLLRPRDVALLIAVATVAAGVVSLGFVATYAVTGVVPWDAFATAVFQRWIGDAIGIVVLTPLIFVIIDQLRHPRTLRAGRHWLRLFEIVVQWASIMAALTLVFGFYYDRYSFQLFYLLFLPLVWIASRHGLAGASWAVVTVQVALIAALEFEDRSVETIRTFQLLMFAVATTGLMLGAVVSEHRRVARALAESEGRLAAILNTARDGVLTIDTRGRIESINTAVEQLFARAAAELLGRDVRELLDAPHLIERLASTAGSPAAESARQEFDARRADGDIFPIELTVGQFGTPGTERYTLVIRDITARREAEARAREHQSELAHVSRLSLAGEMASALAHELNQPLTAIAAFGRGCLRLLRQPQTEPSRITEGVEQVVQEAERAGDIILRLREFVRTGTSQRSAIDVEALIDGAVGLAQIEARQNGIDIEIRIPPDLPPVLADRIQIEQVLVNLLRNGADAILSGGVARRVLTVEARCTADEAIEIAVADSGPGVIEEVSDRLFEPFVTTKPHGMGLGLSISRSIVEAHEGQLRRVRRAGAGATFVFDLPVCDTSEPI